MPKRHSATGAAETPRPTLDALEGSICAIANMAALVRDDTEGAMAGPGGTATVSEATLWGLLQVLDRAHELKEELYRLLREGNVPRA
ncbi:hypothetical protein [Xanthobacter sp. KR7-225]|uniref:hypothetical protein n=1 Tax=Xanthobacter sp. KR7-225 TaxID=3156613 RepID=UPI0032B5041D